MKTKRVGGRSPAKAKGNKKSNPASAPVAELPLKSRLALLLSLIVTVWLLTMSWWYIQTTVEAFKTPLNKGNEMELLNIWLMLIAAVVVSHAIFLRRFVTLLWMAAVGIAAAKILVSSQSVIAALFVIWLLIVSYVWGDWSLRRIGARRSEISLEWASVCVGVGLALLALVGYVMGLFGILNRIVIWSVLVGLTLLQARGIWVLFVGLFSSVRKQVSTARDRAANEYGALVVVIGIIALFNLMWAISPEVHYDGLNYHLPAARMYLMEQKVILNASTLLAHMVEMLFTISLALQGQIVAKLLTFAMSIICTIAIYAIGRASFNSRVGLWAATLFYTTPLVSWLSSNTYVDVTVGMFLACTLLAFLRWRQSRENGWLYACGLLAGAAAGAKMTAFMGLPIIGLVLLWDIVRLKGFTVWSKLRAFSIFLFFALLVSAPWYVKVYRATGNPFFPLLNGVFRSPNGPPQNFNSNAGSFVLGPSRWSIFNMPFAFTFESTRFGEAMAPGSLGLALALFPLALLLLFKRHTVAAILIGAAMAYLLLLGFSMPYGRYYASGLPVITTLAAAAVICLSSVNWLKQINLLCLGAVVIAQAAIIPLMYWNIPERVPVGLARGSETREHFLGRALVTYPATQYVNLKAGPDERVIMVGGENLRFYFVSTMFNPYEAAPFVTGSTPAEWAAALAKNSFTYLVVNRRAAEISLPLPYLKPEFLDQYTEFEYTAAGLEIYRLRERPVELTEKKNLLPNPSFEALTPSGQPAEWTPIGAPRIVKEKTIARSGSVAIFVDKASGAYLRVPVEANKVYSLGHWSRAEKPGQLARLQINWVDQNLQIVGVSIDVVPAGADWAWHKISAVAPPNSSMAQVYVSVHESGEVWFDDYTFVQGSLRAAP